MLRKGHSSDPWTAARNEGKERLAPTPFGLPSRTIIQTRTRCHSVALGTAASGREDARQRLVAGRGEESDGAHDDEEEENEGEKDQSERAAEGGKSKVRRLGSHAPKGFRSRRVTRVDPGVGTYDEMSFFSHILPAHCVSPSDSTVVPHSHDQHVLPARLVGRHSPCPEHALVPFVQADEVVKHSEMEKTGPEPILDDGAAAASWRRASLVEGGVRMRMNGSWEEDRDEMEAWMTPSAVEYCSDAGSRSVSESSERAWTVSDVFSLLKKPVESTHSDSAVSSCFTALLASEWGGDPREDDQSR